MVILYILISSSSEQLYTYEIDNIDYYRNKMYYLPR